MLNEQIVISDMHTDGRTDELFLRSYFKNVLNVSVPVVLIVNVLQGLQMLQL